MIDVINQFSDTLQYLRLNIRSYERRSRPAAAARGGVAAACSLPRWRADSSITPCSAVVEPRRDGADDLCQRRRPVVRAPRAPAWPGRTVRSPNRIRIVCDSRGTGDANLDCRPPVIRETPNHGRASQR